MSSVDGNSDVPAARGDHPLTAWSWMTSRKK